MRVGLLLALMGLLQQAVLFV
ncbi:hypothetical protein LINGRAHAP2_LOCUS11307 [Linum grandiflorum]